MKIIRLGPCNIIRTEMYVISKFSKICGFRPKISQDLIFWCIYLDVILLNWTGMMGWIRNLSWFIMIYDWKQLFLVWKQLIFSNFRWISHSKLPRHQSQKHPEIGTFYMKTVNFHQKRPFYWCFIHNILKWAHFYQKPYVASSYFAFLYLFWPFVKEFLVRSHTEYWAAGR